MKKNNFLYNIKRAQILELKEQNKRLNEQIQINKMNYQNALRNISKEKETDITNLTKHTLTLLSEKDEYLKHLPSEQKFFKSTLQCIFKKKNFQMKMNDKIYRNLNLLQKFFLFFLKKKKKMNELISKSKIQKQF